VAGAGLLAVAVLALVTPLTFGAGTGWPPWCWPVLTLGGAALLAFRSHETRLAASGDPLVHPALLAPAEVRTGLTGIFVLMAAFGGLLFTIAVHLQHTLGHSALRSGLTFAGFSAGFATASLTWPRLPARWHPPLPAAATLTVAAATAALALTTRHGWPWPATVLLAAAGAGSGAGFGAMVQRAAAAVPPAHAGSFGGVLSMTNQLAIITGIAAAGSLYLAIQPDLSWVLLAIAAALAGTAGSRKLR
jgi:MFS family permease